MTKEQVCEVLKALIGSESINTLECLPLLDADVYSSNEVLPVITEVYNKAKQMKKSNFAGMQLDASQTLDLLNFMINLQGFAERLEELYMGDFSHKCTDLTGEGACDLVDTILKKAINLRSLMLPGIGTYKDMFFEDGGCRVLTHSDKSREFLTYLSHSEKLIQNMPTFSGGRKFDNNDSFNLVLECLRKSESIKELYMLRSEFTTSQTTDVCRALLDSKSIETL